MKIAGLVILVLVFVGVPVVSYVVIHGHQYGMFQDRQKSKAGVDLVSAGDTSLSDEPTTDEVEVDTDKSTEKHQFSPAEMQKLMQEAGSNDDGPGPGYDAKSDPYNEAADSEANVSSGGPNLPEGLQIFAKGGEAGDFLMKGYGSPIGIFAQNNITMPTPGGSRFKLVLGSGLALFDQNAFTFGFVLGNSIGGPHVMEELLGSGITVPRIMPGCNISVTMYVKKADDLRATPDGKVYAHLKVRGPNDADWIETQTLGWCY